MKPNVVKEGVKFGVICGLIAILIMYGTWAAGMETFTSVGFWSTFVPYMIVIILFGGLALRKQNGGILAFSDGLKFSFLSYVIAAVIGALGTYILYNLIDPELTQKSMQIAIPKTRAMMEKFGAKDEDIAKAIRDMEAEGAKGTGIKKILLGTGLGLVWDFVKALLITLIIRKEEKFSE